MESSITGWVTERWDAVAKAVLEAAAQLSLPLDRSPAPAVGASAPLPSPDILGAPAGIACGAVLVPRGTTFHNTVPGPLPANQSLFSTEDVIAVASVRLNNATSSTALANILTSPSNGAAPSVIVDQETLLHHAGVTANASLTWTTPLDSDYLLFAFWSRPAGEIRVPARRY